MTSVWQPGTTYVTGELVAPVITQSTLVAAIANAGFELGDSNWTKGAGWTLDTTKPFVGSWSARHTGTGIARLVQAANTAVEPGDRFTASCYYNQGDSPKLTNGARMVLQWLDSGAALLSEALGDIHTSSDAGPRWESLTVTGTAPATAAFVRIAVEVDKDHPANIWVDSVSWNYIPQAETLGFVFRATQAEPGVSGDAEPVWPATAGGTVVDNQVTWTAVATSRVVWIAKPRLRSGGTEPDWPTVPGAVVVDGSMAWECITRRVEDENCPHGPYVAIAASKVYCADDDIIRYSATVNPLDWTTPQDAGYLPYGLQQFGANPVTGLSIYRSNLVAFNSQGFQMWQVDEDPANTALLDALPIGSIHHWALTPVANDLFFLSDQGVRTIGIAASSTNLQAGDVGMPIDPLTQPAVAAATARGIRPLGTYLPSDGQYWLVMPEGQMVLIGNIPDGAVGDSYDELFYALRGVPPYVYSQFAGSMPPGLSFDPETQRVTGVATTPGVFYVTLMAVDSGNSFALSPQVVTITGPGAVQILSRPYPIEVIETLSVGATLHAGLLLQKIVSSSATDSMNVTATLQGGALRVLLQTVTVAAENTNVSATLQGGVLRVALRTETVTPEEMNVSATLQGGRLKQMPGISLTESVDVSATLIGGLFT